MTRTLLHRARPAYEAAAVWVRERSRREQALLAFFGGLLAVMLFWFALVQPLLLARSSAIARVDAYETIKARLGSGGTVSPMAATERLDGAVRSRALTFGLTPASAQMEGRDVVVTLTDARFDSVAPWLAALESTDGLMLSEVDIQRRAGPGMVSVQLRARAR